MIGSSQALTPSHSKYSAAHIHGAFSKFQKFPRHSITSCPWVSPNRSLTPLHPSLFPSTRRRRRTSNPFPPAHTSSFGKYLSPASVVNTASYSPPEAVTNRSFFELHLGSATRCVVMGHYKRADLVRSETALSEKNVSDNKKPHGNSVPELRGHIYT